MERLSDKARMHARLYSQPPYGKEIEGTAELLLQMADKLEEYEGLEEKGKLLKLPCAVGDAVYRINKGAREPIISMEVVEIGTLSLKTGGLAVQITCRDNIGRGEICYLNSDFGRNIFISREEAEAALKEL